MVEEYLSTLNDTEHRQRLSEIFAWVEENYPTLKGEIKWKQAMYTDHGTLIIAFSEAKAHLSFTPEKPVIGLFAAEIEQSGYEHTDNIVKIKWSQEVDYELLRKLIEYNIKDKADCKTFFRK